MSLVIVVVFAVVSAALYVFISPNATAPSAAKVAELAKITFAACAFAIFFAMILGMHETFVKLVK